MFVDRLDKQHIYINDILHTQNISDLIINTFRIQCQSTGCDINDKFSISLFDQLRLMIIISKWKNEQNIKFNQQQTSLILKSLDLDQNDEELINFIPDEFAKMNKLFNKILNEMIQFEDSVINNTKQINNAFNYLKTRKDSLQKNLINWKTDKINKIINALDEIETYQNMLQQLQNKSYQHFNDNKYLNITELITSQKYVNQYQIPSQFLYSLNFGIGSYATFDVNNSKQHKQFMDHFGNIEILNQYIIPSIKISNLTQRLNHSSNTFSSHMIWNYFGNINNNPNICGKINIYINNTRILSHVINNQIISSSNGLLLCNSTVNNISLKVNQTYIFKIEYNLVAPIRALLYDIDKWKYIAPYFEDDILQCPIIQSPVNISLSASHKILSADNNNHPSNTKYQWIVEKDATHSKSEDCYFTANGMNTNKLVIDDFNDCPFKLSIELIMNATVTKQLYTNYFHKTYIKHCKLDLVFYEEPVFGIDLGTTYSCISYQKNSKNKHDRYITTIVRSDKGTNAFCIPSAVYFGDKQLLIGRTAMKRFKTDPLNVIYDIKRIIGRDPIDNEFGTFKQNHLFKISDDNKSVFIPNWNETILFEQILSIILSYLVEIASKEWYYDNINYNPLIYNPNVVVSVPALFHNGQRKSIRSACHLSGLNPIKLVIEPTGASLAYSYYNVAPVANKLKFFLAFDFGGGTLDCSVMRCVGVECWVLSVHGNSALGGRDFDNIIRDIIINKYKQQHKWINISENLYAEIVQLSEQIKIDLTYFNEYQLSLKNEEGDVKQIIITKDEFENHSKTKQLIQSAIDVAHKAIDQTNFKSTNVRMVLMIGGSSKIPIIQKTLKNEFGDILVFADDIDAQLMVATGCGVIGGSSARAKYQAGNVVSEDILLTEIIPMSIGFETCELNVNDLVECGIMDKVLLQNSEYPVKKTFKTCQKPPNADNMQLSLYEGNSRYVKDNYFLGEMEITDMKQRDDHKICDNVLISFIVDENGIFTVEATTNKKYGPVRNYNITIASENAKHGTIKKKDIIELAHNMDSWYNNKQFPLMKKSYYGDPQFIRLFGVVEQKQ